MADFEAIIKQHVAEDGSIPKSAISAIVSAIRQTVGNEFVEKERYKNKLSEIETLKDKMQTAEDNATTADKWKEKYEALKGEFADFKKESAAKETRQEREIAFRTLLREVGISEKRMDAIIRVSDIDAVELEDGKVKNAKELKKSIEEEWGEFIVKTRSEGAKTETPPSGNGSGQTMTRADIYKKDEHGRYILSASERQKAWNDLLSKGE